MTAVVSMEVERLTINNTCNFCRVTNILDKELTMSGFSTFTSKINSISLNHDVSIFFPEFSEQKELFSL